jgi:hypothetical protein
VRRRRRRRRKTVANGRASREEFPRSDVSFEREFGT